MSHILSALLIAAVIGCAIGLIRERRADQAKRTDRALNAYRYRGERHE